MSRFIVFEGIDGAGTTTQAERLVAHLRGSGADVVGTFEPTDGPVGRLIRSILRRESDAATKTLPWLFAADRADHLQRTVLPAIASGQTVVSDRYFHSSLAYQSLEIPLERVWELNQDFPPPDLTVFLDISVDAALPRIEARGGKREIFEERDRLETISAAYERVLALLEGKGHRIEHIDGTQPIDAVADAVLALL